MEIENAVIICILIVLACTGLITTGLFETLIAQIFANMIVQGVLAFAFSVTIAALLAPIRDFF